ncbi:MAG TPA: GNAT family protein [Pyrinomonadaceae bacterium]|jgi:RimJ/RimL family protein N-acetyltransferase|nr:GNAT family protein [Pyrinomonadaceae bacterium]
MSFVELRTPRLVLRRFTDSDLETFEAYRNDPEISRYQSWETFSHQEALEFICEQKSLEPLVPGRWFQFAVALMETQSLVGDCAVKVDEEDTQQAEIGFTFAREHQGKGYASEAVQRLLDFLFREAGLHRVVAITDCENQPAVALLERTGLRREGHFMQNVWFKGKWGDEYLYAILRSEWIQKHLASE